jgi:hypothetical protein
MSMKSIMSPYVVLVAPRFLETCLNVLRAALWSSALNASIASICAYRLAAAKKAFAAVIEYS